MAVTDTHAEELAIDVGELQHSQWLNTIWVFFFVCAGPENAALLYSHVLLGWGGLGAAHREANSKKKNNVVSETLVEVFVYLHQS